MKRLIVTGTIFASLFTYQTGAYALTKSSESTKVSTVNSAEKSKIEKLIFSYQDALNASDAKKVVSLYMNNGGG